MANKGLKEELEELGWMQPKGFLAWGRGNGFSGTTTPIGIFDWNISKFKELFELGLSLPAEDRLKKQICFQQSVVMIVSAYEVYCEDSFCIRLVKLIENNKLDEKRIERSQKRIKDIVDHVKKSVNKLDYCYKLIDKEKKWNFQNLQNCNEIYKEVFHINLCHDLSKEIEKNWNAMDDYIDYRHCVVHTAGMYCKPANINEEYVINCAKIFVDFIHRLEEKLNEIIEHPQTGSFNLSPPPQGVIEGRSIF